MSDNVFHRHLDVCTQCAQFPWELCKDGARLLKEAADTAAAEMAVHSPLDDDGYREPRRGEENDP